MKKKIFILIAFLGLMISSVSAQNEKFKALFIFNFTKHVEWNAAKKSGDFVIAVYGSTEVYAALKAIASTKTVGQQHIRVEKVSSPEDIEDCHIFYMASSKSSKIDDIRSRFAGKQVLIVGDKPGLITDGVGINLVTVGGKQKFEISKGNIQTEGMKVSTALLSLGIIM